VSRYLRIWSYGLQAIVRMASGIYSYRSRDSSPIEILRLNRLQRSDNRRTLASRGLCSTIAMVMESNNQTKLAFPISLSIWIWMGTRFSTKTYPLSNSSSLLSNPQAVLVDDSDNANGNDIVVALYSGNSIVIRLNDGSGGFPSTSTMIALAPQGNGLIALVSVFPEI